MSKSRIETFLQEVQENRGDLFPIVIRLREIVLASGSAITEEVKYGGLLFSSSKSFCGVFAYKTHVTIEFSNGASLQDPHKVLSGNGKYRRNIKILNLSDIKDKQVAKYVRMARQAAEC